MRILLGLDDQTYSEFAVKQTAKLASNVWADVTMLASVPSRPEGALQLGEISSHRLYPAASFPAEADMLRRYWKIFMDHCPADAPYFEESVEFYLAEVKDRTFEEVKIIRSRRKDLKLRLRQGPPADNLIKEAKEDGHDLIIIGCGKGEGCTWKNPGNVPQRVVDESGCSVMVVKEDREIKNISCYLDEDNVSQESLEMVNQLATMHAAGLSLVGLTRDLGIRYDVDQQLWRTQEYFSSRGIETFVQLKEVSELDRLLVSDDAPDLAALWMGKKSLLNRFTPKGWSGEMVRNSPCSVVILR